MLQDYLLMFDNGWYGVKDGDERVYLLFSRHYSCYQYQDNRRVFDKRFVGPSTDRLVLLTPDCKAAFIWKIFKDPSGQQGLYNSLFRNEGPQLSSDLILKAEWLALQKWPDAARFYTYIDPNAVESANPGYCYKIAGWQLVRDENGKPIKTAVNKRLIFEKYPEVK